MNKLRLLLLALLLAAHSFSYGNTDQEIQVISITEQRIVRVKISDGMSAPLSIFIFDKKGNQLKYKYWEASKQRIIDFKLPVTEKNYFTLEVVEDGKTILKRNLKLS